ncbi:hypothetical protein EDD22DRAFT_882109, partial [Suillus occidentalis]
TEKMSATTVMTHCDSATSMSITNVLALSSTNRLTPAERKAFGKSDHKASKVLGVTLTRNRVGRVHHDRSSSLCLPQDQENAPGDDTLEGNIAISAKRPCNRNASAATVIGPLKYLGRMLASGIGMVEKRNKHRMVAEGHTQRVVLGATGVGNDSALSLPEVDESEDIKALLGAECSWQNDEEGEGVASLCYAPNFEVSSEEESPALSSDDSFDDILRPVEQAYLDFLIAQDEAEEQLMERRRERRAALRSRNKILDVLGAEARHAVYE